MTTPQTHETSSRARVAVVQLCAKTDIGDNISRASQLVRRAVGAGAQAVLLPENFCFIGGLKRKVEIAESLDAPGPIIGAMQALARECGVHLLVGGLPTRAEAGLAHNTALVLGPDGSIISHYHKIHLFDIAIPDGAVFQESEFVQPGREVVTTQLLGTTLGLSICYDLRFPELYRSLARRGAEVLTVPAAFTMHTGKDHWFPLLRARAIENVCYVMAANQWGRHNEERASYGKSCIIDPWGAIVAQVSDLDGYALAELDFGHLRKIRQQLPCLNHVRL